MKLQTWLIPFAGLLAAPVDAGHAQPAPSVASAPPSVAGWDEFVDSLRALPGRMLAKLPEDQRNDPQVQQEVGRLALEALAAQTLDAIAGDPDHPAFISQIGQVLNVGQPNADTVYRTARVRPEGTYRLRGVRGTLRLFNISQSPPSPGEPGFKPEGGARTRHEFGDLHVDAQGRFDVILSPERPAGYKGDWWKLEPTTTKLLMRMVSADWAKEQDPTISIERVDIPITRPRPPAADLEQRLRQLPGAVNFLALLFVDHVEKLRQEGYVNKLKVFDITQVAGLLTGQAYYEGAYDLADDEALIVEAKAPAKCGYRSLILTNDLYETTDWYNNLSSLNDAQAPLDKDGVLRIVVSAKDPGVPNWLDTAGHRRGLIQGRWTDCDSQPTPSVRKVALADVRKSLPPETPTVSPAEREKLIRERRAALQERPLW
ncbi:hypothetical protein LJR225_004404 [Phenylobacterium sp. LjRoot225]|uniref:hypothetical protein n=1 Tax=Phenylobacterium sp. LjRoot225 TaxID=3342285 RepID=UPI003ECCFCA3